MKCNDRRVVTVEKEHSPISVIGEINQPNNPKVEFGVKLFNTRT